MMRTIDMKWLSLVLINGVVILMICVKHTPVNPGTIDLSLFETRLIAIETKLDQPTLQPDLAPINQNIKQLGQFIQQLQNKDDHQLGELFSTGQGALKKQLDGITELLSRLDEQKNPIKTLPVSSLPFAVLSIDSVQEISVATVAYNYKTKALEKGDSLGGWKVVQLDFAKQLIEFENVDKAHVIIYLDVTGVGHA